ncbi:uncharacterized protein PG998_010898 [Apiospora kogelbergensis]|uniref:Uncharacterized protein n=1 Tax=Apiospora kogelbergensis TaxID=1337665 RepID=A0AAW0RDB6_9PEZI
MTQKTASSRKPVPLVIFPTELLSIPTTNTTIVEPGPEPIDKPPLLTGITHDSVYSFYGLFDDEAGTAAPHSLAMSAAVSIASTSDGNPDRLAGVLHRFLENAQRDCMTEAAPPDQRQIIQACWLVVRMFKPSEEYEVPRWHRDGRMFPCSCSTVKTQEEGEDKRLPHSKYAVTLLGPPTRVLKPHEAVDAALDRVRENRGLGYDESRERAELAEASRGCEEYEVRRGQVIRFSWGQGDSPVHSEPDFGGEDRVFVSVLFGSEEEIREMCRWRQETFGEVKVRG